MWSDRLFPARWRDFEFLAERHDAKSGRRLIVHEYPGADVPRVEDLGSSSDNWTINAYFIGADYDLARNRFLTLLAEPGPAWLTHPWLGEKWARAKEWSASESTDKGGYCVVNVEFVPGGETAQPLLDTETVARDAVSRLANVIVANFDLLPLPGQTFQDYLAAVHRRLENLRRLLSLASLPVTRANQVVNVISGVKTDLTELLAKPDAYANAFLSIASALGLRRTDSESITDASRAKAVGNIIRAARPSVPETNRDPVFIHNLRVQTTFERRLMMASAMSLGIHEYTSSVARDSVANTVNQAAREWFFDAPDEVFHASETARAEVLQYLEAQRLPNHRRRLAYPMPSALVSYNLGMTEEAFLSQNAVRHPLFVQGEVVYG